jgi:glycosyltransferase involved in cell wall biosynthesis
VRVSVVIPALNEERHLGQLLSDIQRQSLRPNEVIVVDAGSCDATVRIAKQAPTRFSTASRPSRVAGM